MKSRVEIVEAFPSWLRGCINCFASKVKSIAFSFKGSRVIRDPTINGSVLHRKGLARSIVRFSR